MTGLIVAAILAGSIGLVLILCFIGMAIDRNTYAIEKLVRVLEKK